MTTNQISPETSPFSTVEWTVGRENFLASRIFGREAPLEIEIGFGKGRFLLKNAVNRPGTDFVGIERAGKYFRIARDRATKRRLTNLKLVRTDARLFVEELLPDRSVDRVHVYFPDPWPKRRQHKRRLLDPPFLRILATKLRDGGEVHLATDHAEYFRAILLSFETEPGFAAAETPSADPEGLTNYEVKYRTEGRPIYRALWTLRSESSRD